MGSSKKQSLQAILKHRQQQIFVGRTLEENLFQQNLTLDDDSRLLIFNVFGQGGVGKTTLLRRFYQDVERVGALPVWTDEGQKDVLAVMAEFAKQFKQRGSPLQRFDKMYDSYLEHYQTLAADPHAPQGIVDFMGMVTKAGVRIGRHTPAGIVLDFVEEEKLAKGVGDLVSYVSSKLSKNDARLIQHPIEVLTQVFLEDLWGLPQERLFAFFFDTYEYTSEYLDSWLNDCIAGRHGEMPGNVLLIIAGRHELDRNRWEVYDSLSTRIPLEPFTEPEALAYLKRKGIVDKQISKVLLQLSDSLPLLLAILTTERPSNPRQIEDLSGTAVERFLKWIEDPKRRQITINAALPRHFNRDILAELVDPTDADLLFDWLKQMPFVKEQHNGWVYHEVVRSQMLRYKYRASHEQWSDIHSRLASFYERHQQDLDKDQISRGFSSWEGPGTLSVWQELALEKLYHRLAQAPNQELSSALADFLSAFTIDPFARRWAETINQVGEEIGISELNYWGKLLIEGVKAFDEGVKAFDGHRFQTSIDMLNQLMEKIGTGNKGYLKALFDRANLYRMAERDQEALADYDQYLSMNPDDYLALFARSSVYVQIGRKEDLRKDFDRIEEIAPGFLDKLLTLFMQMVEENEDLKIKVYKDRAELDGGDG